MVLNRARTSVAPSATNASRPGGLTVVADGLLLPECPRWRDGRFWFSDFYALTVSWIAPSGEVQVCCRLDDRPGGLGWMPDGEMLVVSMSRRLLLRVGGTGDPKVHADLTSFGDGPLNDLLVDGGGRAYVGGFGYDLFGGEPGRPAPLLCVEPDGTARVVARRLRFPNGMVLLDERTLVVAETFASCLTAFDRRLDGSLHGRRLWAAIAGVPPSTPDGIAVDAAGCMWVADPGGRRVVRVAHGGTIMSVIDTAPERPFACALGGADGRTMLICVGRSADPERARQQQAGRLLQTRVPVPARSKDGEDDKH